MELSICTTDESRTVELTLRVVCACVNFVIRRSSRFYNTQRTWQPLWWRRNVWCFTVAEAVRRANRKLSNIIMTRAVYSHTTLNAIQYYIIIDSGSFTRLNWELRSEPCCKLFCYTSKMDANPKHGNTLFVDTNEFAPGLFHRLPSIQRHRPIFFILIPILHT